MYVLIDTKLRAFDTYLRGVFQELQSSRGFRALDRLSDEYQRTFSIHIL